MIIDTHTHFYDPSRPQGVPWPSADEELLYRTALPEHFKALAVPEGVTGTVVVEASGWLEDNQWILDLAADEPLIVGFVGNIEAGRPQFGAELAHYATNPLFRGIRCGGRYFEQAEQSAFLADLALLTAHDLALDVLINQQHFDALLATAHRLPELRIVVNHIGHMTIEGTPLAPVWRQHYARLAAAPNIHMKVSALMENSAVQPAPTDVDFYRPLLDTLWSTFGADRLIYGSNWTVCERSGTYATCIDIVRAYFREKGADAEESYFWRNAKRVYKWLDR